MRPPSAGVQRAQDRILDALRAAAPTGRGVTRRWLAEVLALRPQTVSEACSQLVRAGAIVRWGAGPGTYFWISQPESSLDVKLQSAPR